MTCEVHTTVGYQILQLISRRDSENDKMNFYISYEITVSNGSLPRGTNKLNYRIKDKV